MDSAKKKKRLEVATDKHPQDQQHRPVTTNIYFFALLLIVSTVLLYGHSLWNPLVFDDKLFFVGTNLERLGSSFFHLDLRGFAYATFGWTYKLFGLDWFWYRLGNLSLHALTTVLLFVFFSRLLDATAQAQDALARPRWSAFFTALIFALHPAAVYGVAYLVQRSIIMATLFGIASLLCYMEGLSRDKAKWFVASALCYFLAVFSKEHSIMIPGVAAALTLLLHKPSLPLLKRVWLPFALYLVIGTLIFQRTKGLLGAEYEFQAAEMLAQMNEHQQSAPLENAYMLSVITQGYLFFKYLLLWIVPYTGWMAIDIRQPFATHLLSWPQTAGFVLFLAYPVLALKLLLQGGRSGLLGFGMLFPWILYLTELAAVRIQEPFVLYRSYLWMSGLPVVLLSFVGAVPRKFVPAMLAVCCLVLTSLAWNRLETFSTHLKLWYDATEKNQDDRLLGMERIYNNRGMVYMEFGEFQKAQKDFIKSATLNPKYHAAHSNLGGVNFLLKNFQAALQSYNTAIELNPDYVTARINRSALLTQMGRYADALNDCEYVLQLDAQNTDAYLNCGIAHSAMGKTQEALRYMDDALRINPHLVSTYISRSVINSKLGHHDSALGDLDQATRIDPKNASIYYNRGIVHGAMGRHQDAMQDYNKAIALSPDYVDAYVNRGKAYEALGRLPEALADYQRTIALYPEYPEGYYNTGYMYFKFNNLEEALQRYNTAIELKPDYVEAYVNRGVLFTKMGRHAEAFSDYDRAGQLSPGDPISYLNRAIANFNLGKFQKALKDYDKALSLDAKNNQALFYRGAALSMLNRKSEAMASFRKSCNAGNQEACNQLR